MKWIQLDGWALANARGQGVLKDEDKQTFYVNADAPGVLTPAHRGDREGYLLEMADHVWFLEVAPEQVSQMVQGWAPGPSA